MFFKLNLKISSIGLVLEYLNAPGPVPQKTDRSVILTDRYVRVCFNSYKNFLNHNNKRHAKIFACEKCDFIGNTDRTFRMHMISEHGESLFKCSEFVYQAKRTHLLRLHQKSKHEGAVHKCNQCDIEFTKTCKRSS